MLSPYGVFGYGDVVHQCEKRCNAYSKIYINPPLEWWVISLEASLFGGGFI